MKRSRLKIIFALPLAAVACLLVFFLAGIPFSIPNIAEQSFGPPTVFPTVRPMMSTTTRYKQTGTKKRPFGGFRSDYRNRFSIG